MSNPLLSELAHTSTVRRRAAGLAGQVSSVLPVVTKPPRRLALKLGVAGGATAPNGWRRGEVSQCARGTGACAEAPAGTGSAGGAARPARRGCRRDKGHGPADPDHDADPSPPARSRASSDRDDGARP